MLRWAFVAAECRNRGAWGAHQPLPTSLLGAYLHEVRASGKCVRIHLTHEDADVCARVQGGQQYWQEERAVWTVGWAALMGPWLYPSREEKEKWGTFPPELKYIALRLNRLTHCLIKRTERNKQNSKDKTCKST